MKKKIVISTAIDIVIAIVAIAVALQDNVPTGTKAGIGLLALDAFGLVPGLVYAFSAIKESNRPFTAAAPAMAFMSFWTAGVLAVLLVGMLIYIITQENWAMLPGWGVVALIDCMLVFMGRSVLE